MSTSSSPKAGRNTHGISINIAIPSDPAQDEYTSHDPAIPSNTALRPSNADFPAPDPQSTTAVTSLNDDVYLERELPPSRATSVSSSLDPYYFGLQSPSDSPLPALPPIPMTASTPDHPVFNEPTTPARNPASIDRRGLVGVGELATPRWTRSERKHGSRQDDSEHVSFLSGVQVVVPDDEPDPESDDWSLNAIESENNEHDMIAVQPPPKPLRSRRSAADESGGEEILYPRISNASVAGFSKSGRAARQSSSSIRAESSRINDDTPKSTRLPDRVINADVISPPTSFNTARRARKRTSDEFEMDQHGVLLSKSVGSGLTVKDAIQDDKSSLARKHRSLNVSTSSTSSKDSKARDRRRESLGISISGITKSFSTRAPERHSRQLSAGSLTSPLSDNSHSRRVQTTDFSHLPPSPASSSIQHILRHSVKPHTPPPPLGSKDATFQHATSPSVAHSLLRGTQEGWSALDDEATAEALRKLDGLTGKAARARASVGGIRSSSSSRPATPASKGGSQWEGIGSDHSRTKRSSGTGTGSERENVESSHKHTLHPTGPISHEPTLEASPDEQSQTMHPQEKTPKKSIARMSFTPKRGSTSSTYASTPTTSSRDSASMSAGTSLTSISATSGRLSSGKTRRNSANSEVYPPSDTNSIKDRVASIAGTGDTSEGNSVPPVPPLPKDLSSYRSPPPTSSSLSFPALSSGDELNKRSSHEIHSERNTSLEVPLSHNHPPSQLHQQSQQPQPTSDSSVPLVPKTPSKKWSFSNALNLRLSGSPSSGPKSGFPLSPRAVSFGTQLRKSTSKDKGAPTGPLRSPWSPEQPDAMTSAGSLTSLSSIGSARISALPTNSSKTPDRGTSRPGTASSASTNNATSALSAPPTGALSPSSSIRRTRLTPSSIPFFRRSSSQSMQVAPPIPTSASPTSHLATPRSKNSASPNRDHVTLSTSVPGSTSKKTSVLGLALPSLLKSQSRRSLHGDAKDSGKENSRSDKDSEKGKSKMEKERRREEKDRSESRISLMIRKRGKTLSSTDNRKPARSPVTMPPMQISALEPTTAQRVAKLKSSTTSSTTSSATRTPSTSRFTQQTISSLQKLSDASLRTRTQLPTIAGSPSVGTAGSNSQITKEFKEPLPPPSTNTSSSLIKETPTKIPRISSAASVAVPSPPLKQSSSALATRRASGLASVSANPSPTGLLANEFGVIGHDEGATPKSSAHMRASPSASISRVPRQTSTTSTTNSILHRKANRDSMSFMGLRKPSTSSSTATTSVSTANAESSSHRFSALSPSKGLKLLGPKPSLRSANSISSQSMHQTTRGSPSSSRQSLSTPSPVPSSVDEEEILGDEEMMNYIKRQQAKKIAAGATQEELDEMLKFPEPIPPTQPLSPDAVLRSSQAQNLSEYERKEIQDYASIYYTGAKSKKNMATLDHNANNYGYDDERGDYLVVNHDHLAYRYEVIDTLGKGSFGQVLHCRDHCTGESVAVKIIRNKKRFHHQALVEIKILDNLRKWDKEEKHHVIKMNDHFYFRNHLCIATELLSINLYELIKANGFVGFTTSLIRRFTTQMLLSLLLMRHHGIVHCDLKPENVLLKHPTKSAIKVIDFGSSCFENEKIYTYIQSRFYRSPEVILGMSYHMAIDMWSLGCIMAELYTGYPLFPGENEQEQLSCIMEILGVPEKEFVNKSSRKKLFFDTSGAPRATVNSKGRRRRPGSRTLAQALKCTDEDFVDFIAKCLVWDPERRMKPQAAMRHPFILAGKRKQMSSSILNSRSTPSTSTNNSRSRTLLETPKKSMISAPTPLTARSSRTTANGVPTTPSTTHNSTFGSTTRSFRTSQSQSISSSYHSSRTMSGYVSHGTIAK